MNERINLPKIPPPLAPKLHVALSLITQVLFFKTISPPSVLLFTDFVHCQDLPIIQGRLPMEKGICQFCSALNLTPAPRIMT